MLRAIGGHVRQYGAHSVTWWVMWVSWICLFLLSYPQTDFTVATVNGPKTFHIGLNVYAFTALMGILGICLGLRQGQRVQVHQRRLPQNIGTISGIVGLAGGMGGFILPIMFGALMDWTGIRSSAFMLMYGVVWVSLIWMYWTEVRRTAVMGSNVPPRRWPRRSSDASHPHSPARKHHGYPQPSATTDGTWLSRWEPENTSFWSAARPDWPGEH